MLKSKYPSTSISRKHSANAADYHNKKDTNVLPPSCTPSPSKENAPSAKSSIATKPSQKNIHMIASTSDKKP